MWRVRHQLMVVVLAFPLFAGCINEPPPSSGSAVDEPALDTSGLIGGWVQEATWSAEWQGDLAIRLSVASPKDVECDWQWGAWGVSQDLRPTVGQLVEGHDGPTSMTVGRGQGSLTNVDAHTSAADAVDEQALQEPRPWASGSNRTYDLKAGHEVNFTFLAVGLATDNVSAPSWADYFFPPGLEEANVFIRLACEGSVQVVALGAGQNVVAFDETSFRGGATAHVYGGREATGMAVGSRVGADLATQHGLMFVKVWGDFLGSHVSAGVIETEYPGGGDVLVDHPTLYAPTCGLQLPGCPFVSKHYEAGPGAYSVAAK